MFQKEFVERMLIREKEWYDKEKIDVKFINFFDNSEIVGKHNRKKCKKSFFGKMIVFLIQFSSPDIYDNKINGIFTLLDDQCKQKVPDTARFTENVNNIWKGHTAFMCSATPSSQKHEFTICHFAKNVCYLTVI